MAVLQKQGYYPSTHYEQPAVRWPELVMARHREIPGTISSVTSAMKEYPFLVSDVMAVNLAMTEALTNAIVHGNRNDPRKFVLIQYHVNSQSLSVAIEDQGTGFDLSQLQVPRSRRRHHHGKGLHLMRSFMTSVDFEGPGNRVILRRERGRSPSIASLPADYDFQI